VGRRLAPNCLVQDAGLLLGWIFRGKLETWDDQDQRKAKKSPKPIASILFFLADHPTFVTVEIFVSWLGHCNITRTINWNGGRWLSEPGGGGFRAWCMAISLTNYVLQPSSTEHIQKPVAAQCCLDGLMISCILQRESHCQWTLRGIWKQEDGNHPTFRSVDIHIYIQYIIYNIIIYIYSIMCIYIFFTDSLSPVGLRLSPSPVLDRWSRWSSGPHRAQALVAETDGLRAQPVDFNGATPKLAGW
jgi:hypothetical protein